MNASPTQNTGPGFFFLILGLTFHFPAWTQFSPGQSSAPSHPRSAVERPGVAEKNQQTFLFGKAGGNGRINLHSAPITKNNQRDQNYQSSFKTVFGGPKDEFGNSMAVAGDCGLLVAGETGSYGNGVNDGMITKLDQSGAILWSRAVGGELDEYFLKIQKLPDDNYIATGLHGDPNSLFGRGGFAWLVKLDPAGEIIWDRSYTDGTVNGNYARDICQTPDGGFAICGTYGNLANAAGYKLMVAKIDASGNPKWTKTFYAGTNVEAGRKNIMLTPDNNLLVAAYVEDVGRVRKALLTKIDANTGVTIWAKSYTINSSSTWFEQIDLKSNLIFLNTFVLAPNKRDIQNHLLKLDLDGNILSCIRIKVPQEAVAKIFPLSDSLMLIASDDVTNPDHLVLAKLSTNGKVYWTKKYELSFFVSPSDIALLTDSNLVICGTNLPGFSTTPGAAFREAFIIKTDFEGAQQSCPVENGLTETEPSTAVLDSFDWLEISDIKLIANTPGDKSIPIQPEQDKICGVSPACIISSIRGEDSVCRSDGSHDYSVSLPTACVLPLQWNIDPSFAEVLSQTDSSISLRFLRKGRVQLSAGAGSVCSASNKSMDISILEGPRLDISKDAVLCGSDPLTLQAPAGMESYLWQDGSTGSSFTLNQPGYYWVEVSDTHHCVARDTAVVEVKDCGRNIYFPNAFTPGNDQLNDVYRPKVFGTLSQFSMKIYNRVGQLVFESHDPTQGWDGSFHGKAQPTSSFTWYATYRFAGSDDGVKMQKGILTLIR